MDKSNVSRGIKKLSKSIRMNPGSWAFLSGNRGHYSGAFDRLLLRDTSVAIHLSSPPYVTPGVQKLNDDEVAYLSDAVNTWIALTARERDENTKEAEND